MHFSLQAATANPDAGHTIASTIPRGVTIQEPYAESGRESDHHRVAHRARPSQSRTRSAPPVVPERGAGRTPAQLVEMDLPNSTKGSSTPLCAGPVAAVIHSL